MTQSDKDFSSISPSAKSVLLAKSYTDIPYAKEVAALMDHSEIFRLSFDENDFWFLARVLHFELRYKSIDQLLQQTNYQNILELSSGYSFRGIDYCQKHPDIHFIDTDLPEVVRIKRQVISDLQLDESLLGHYELQPLNALEEHAFQQVTQGFDEGPLSLVNEGLMMYLNEAEQARLCSIIHDVLRQRGGCWINADVCVRRAAAMPMQMPMSEQERHFFEQHQIEENKYESFDTALEFFKAQGFRLVKEAEQHYEQLSVMPRLLKVMPEAMRNRNAPPPKMQAAWLLEAI